MKKKRDRKVDELFFEDGDCSGGGYEIYRNRLYDEPPIPWQKGVGHFKPSLICDSERIFRFGNCCKRDFAAKRKIAVKTGEFSEKTRVKVNSEISAVYFKPSLTKKTTAALIFCLATFCVLLLGCRVSVSTDREAKDVEAQFHFLKVKNAGDWQDTSDKSLFQYGNDSRMRENGDKSFVFTLDKDTPPEKITNWFFSTSLGKDVQGVEASISFLNGSPGMCGIYFPATPDAEAKNQEYYFFGVNNIGQFALYYKPPIGNILPIVRAEECKWIHKGYDAENILTAYADGASLVFQINGETVRTVENAELTEGRTGIFVRTRAKTDD